MNTNQILEERGSTHGSFAKNSRISQEMKHFFRRETLDKSMSHEMCEAMDMILHKISRIAAGDAYHVDHWADIAGYATLVVKSLQQEKEDELVIVE